MCTVQEVLEAMRHLSHIRKIFPGGLGLVAVLTLLTALAGCASGGGGKPLPAAQEAARSTRPGTQVVDLEFLYSFENEASAPYYPLETVAGCAFSPEGTLIFCDEGRGKIYGLEAGTRRWYEFDAPLARPFRPVDVQVDGFKVLVLDSGGGSIYRFDLAGSWQDVLLDVGRVDPAAISRGTSFDVDRDGRLIIADQAQLQILLLDAFLQLNMRLGEPGTQDDQFNYLGGVTFLPDGSILASDSGNSRLCWYGRLGFFESTVGGDYDPANPFAAPAGLDSDRFGNVFVTDPGNSLIHVLDARFRLVFSTGREVDLLGSPVSPVDVAVGPDNLLAVTDQGRSAVIVYRIIYE